MQLYALDVKCVNGKKREDKEDVEDQEVSGN